MPQPARRTIADKVLIQHIEADVDIGFGLVDSARAYRDSGQLELSARVLLDAADVVADIERRLHQLGETASIPFQPLVAELRQQIAGAKREPS